MFKRTQNADESLSRLGVGLAITLCLFIVLTGCSFVPESIPQIMTPRATAPPVSTRAPTATWPPTWTPLPTRTPTPTYTPTPTTTPLPPGTRRPPSTPGAAGPLTLEFWVNNVWCEKGFYGYIMDFTVRAHGGGGQYTYYRDIDKIGGPTNGSITYQLRWTDCGGAPGTFFAHSADGQRASKEFWVDNPSCCVKRR